MREPELLLLVLMVAVGGLIEDPVVEIVLSVVTGYAASCPLS